MYMEHYKVNNQQVERLYGTKKTLLRTERLPEIDVNTRRKVVGEAAKRTTAT